MVSQEVQSSVRLVIAFCGRALARGVVIAVRCRQDGLLRRVPHCSAGVLQTRELVHGQVLAQAGDRITHPASAKLMWRQQDVNRRVLPFLAE